MTTQEIKKNIINDIKSDLFNYDEAFTSQGMTETLDIAVPFLQQLVEDDSKCEDLLRAILGDAVSAKNINNALDRMIGRYYIDDTMLGIEEDTGD